MPMKAPEGEIRRGYDVLIPVDKTTHDSGFNGQEAAPARIEA